MKEFLIRYTDLAASDDRLLKGTAILFDVESEILYDGDVPYTEVIKRGAITQELINSCDIILTYNHEEKQAVPLARSNKGTGSLKITVTESGVDFSCRLKNTYQSNEVYEAVRQGDLSGCSFKFYVNNADHKFIRRSDGTYLHEVYKIAGIRDLSIVTVPAYSETSVYARQLAELKTADEQRIIEEKEAQERQLQEETEAKKIADEKFNQYYQQLINKYLNN